MAQLVAHHTGSVGVRGSSPLSSTFWFDSGIDLGLCIESLMDVGPALLRVFPVQWLFFMFYSCRVSCFRLVLIGSGVVGVRLAD